MPLHPTISAVFTNIYPALNEAPTMTDLETYKEELIIYSHRDEVVLQNALYRDFYNKTPLAIELMGKSRDFAAMALEMLKVENY